jgi:NAD(P)-dependent dehydrogenase (short-subunit alcohol dehydrogenase family)
MPQRTVLITGGCSGIGFATAALLVERKFRVILLDRNQSGLDKARKKLVAAGAAGRDIETLLFDLAEVEKICDLPSTLRLSQEGLAGLVYCAAVQFLKPVTRFSLKELEATWRVNMMAPVVMIQAFHPWLKKAKGTVIMIGSVADEDYYARYSLYGSSKAFLKSFTKHVCRELGFDGIRINLVSPGATQTPMLRELIANGTLSRKVVRDCKKNIPIERRFARPREIAEAVFFVLTGPRYLHGADIRINGGMD